MREYNLKLDDVINEQRGIIYTLRNRILEQDDRINLLIPMIEETVNNEIDETCAEEILPEDWPVNSLLASMNSILSGQSVSLPEAVTDKSEVEDSIKPALNNYAEEIESLRNQEDFQAALKYVMTAIIDIHWIQHLEGMTRLKEGIGLRHYQQEDPMRIYQREGLELFTITYHKIEKAVSLEAASMHQRIKEEKQEQQKH
jgi:preprotein translocase subunit SecA